MENEYNYFETSNTKILDDFYRLCLHAGLSYNIEIKNNNIYKLRVNKVDDIIKVNENIQQDKWIEFDGKVYCCTVPGEGIIYVRRDIKPYLPVWSGNSLHG
jgi:hypothetical protein